MILNLLNVALGGALGAVARWLIGLGLPFPFGTLAVNLTGSFLIGVIWAGGALRWHPLLITGVLGGFTTFSAFSLDVIRLIEGGRVGTAGAYAAGSVGLSVLACAAGLWLVRT